MKSRFPGVIYLNGASCAGKTSLATALQDLLPEPYLHVKLDDFIAMLPDTLVGTNEAARQGFYWQPNYSGEQISYDIITGEAGSRLMKGMHACWLALLENDNKLIIDDVCFGAACLDKSRALLKDYQTLYVGVFCELGVLKEREAARGDRLVGSVERQHAVVHQGITYDIKVDSTHATSNTLAAQIIEFIERS